MPNKKSPKKTSPKKKSPIKITPQNNSPIVIHDSRMGDEMQREALQVALLAVNLHKTGLDIATYITTEFDRVYGCTWHCIVGSCCFRVQPDNDSYINFSVGANRITLFKSA